MRKFLIFVAMVLLAHFAVGCGIFGGKTYDGSEAYTETHPELAQPPSYMDPDRDYTNDSK